MMDRVTVALALFSFALSGAAFADKLAFVDMRRAIQECAEGKVAQKKLSTDLEAKQKVLDAEKTTLKEKGEALKKEETVLKAEEPTRGSRLALCDLTARTLQTGLSLLGIAVPERM